MARWLAPWRRRRWMRWLVDSANQQRAIKGKVSTMATHAKRQVAVMVNGLPTAPHAGVFAGLGHLTTVAPFMVSHEGGVP